MIRKFCLLLALFVSACTLPQDKERIAQLEKQTKELQTQVDKTADLDLQAKCATGAKTYFEDKWRPENALLLEYSNHYNKSLSKCFILVQRKYVVDVKLGYVATALYVDDIYEHAERAVGMEMIKVSDLREQKDSSSIGCTIDGKKKDVKTMQDCFNLLQSTFMQK